ncbi:hypothetical protein H7I41_13800 [Mycobacterium manitobense]|uniref:Uncharacterized protein n=1 Tax=[Mycobacterium] manitobense TaxID=190147 RepID=A0A9X3BX19_9MYCO|nr:hypothetical protein [[Mycobacterium] manitobense]MCV7170987.1 hypothetical protein [[Mycobacterium] manitobense]
MTDEVLDLLLELERAGWDSLCNSTGSEFYAGVMLPDAVYTRTDAGWKLALYQQTQIPG